MTYTKSDGLKDREYAKFSSEQTGSQTAINVSNLLKTYDFGTVTASTKAGSGLFTAHTTYEINGMLKSIVIKDNNFEDTGSLYLRASGLNYDVWSMQSGTVTSSVATSGVYIPKGIMRTTENVSMSGTLAAGMLGDIPMYGVYTIIGSGMGDSTSGLGIVLVYQ